MWLEPGAELTAAPLQLIAVTGLNTANSEVHAGIWQALTQQRRSDRLPLAFQLVGAQYTFPAAKPKRSTYDGYEPAGIFKLNYARKHLNQLPAVVVLFVDLDWNHPNWAEKKTECQSKVESLRHSLEGRNTRVAVVLVQSAQPLPPGEDVLAAERATQLCTCCDISPKALFVLPSHTNHQFGYILRLEQAFHELAATYYTAEIRRIKAKKESLSKSTHHALLVRCQIKLAFMNELKQDSHTALRHNKLAYQHLIEMATADVNYSEWKTVAALLNFNICRLCFAHNVPLDAIGHFKRHIEFFAARVGCRPDAVVAGFEHSAWLCRQHAMFGEQFEKAVQAGLAAIQTQHPGFYYQMAAQHAHNRRDAVEAVRAQLKAIGAVYPEQDDPLAAADRIEYLGQRPWRLQCTHDQPADEHVEAAAALALKIVETQQDVSSVVVQLLNAASSQYKRYRCPRMRTRINVLLADEYVTQQQLQKALQLYMHVLWEYRSERWWSLVRSVCASALRVCYSLASLNEYIAVAMQLLNPVICADPTTRQRVADNLHAILSGQQPAPEPDAANDAQAAANWTRVLSERSFFMVQMQPIYGALLARADFIGVRGRTHKTLCINQPLRVRVLLHSMCPLPLTFRKLSVKFGLRQAPVHTFEASDSLPAVSCDDAGQLTLQPNATQQLVFDVPLHTQHVNTDIAITCIALDVGSLQSPVCGSFHWDDCAGSVPADAISVEYSCIAAGVLRSQAGQSLLSTWTTSTDSVVSIEQRVAGAELVLSSADEQLYVADARTLTVKLNNTEPTAITNVRLHMSTRTVSVEEEGQQQQPGGNGLRLCTKAQSQWTHNLMIQCADLPPHQFASLPVQCVSDEAGTFLAECQLTYNVSDNGIECECVQRTQLQLQATHAINVNTRLTTLNSVPVDVMVAAERVLLQVELTAADHTCVNLGALQWHPSPGVALDAVTPSNQTIGARLASAECYSALAAVECAQSTVEPLALGHAILQWKRGEDGTETEWRSLHIPLPSPLVRLCPVLVGVSRVPVAAVREPVQLTYDVRNVGSVPIALALTLNTPDTLMFSGRKQTAVRLLPGECCPLTYVLFALVAGFVPLPTFSFQVVSDADGTAALQDTLNMLAQRSLPTHLFVLVGPSGIGIEDGPNDAHCQY